MLMPVFHYSLQVTFTIVIPYIVSFQSRHIWFQKVTWKTAFLIFCTLQINVLIWALTVNTKYISQRYHSTIPCTSFHWTTCFPILLQSIEFSKFEKRVIFISFFWVFHNYIFCPFLFFTPNPFIFCSPLSFIFMSFF